MAYLNYVQGNVDTVNNGYNLLVSGASSGYTQTGLMIGGDTNTSYGLRISENASHNAYVDMRGDMTNHLSLRYKDNTSGVLTSMLDLANDATLTGTGYGAVVHGRMKASAYYVGDTDTRTPVNTGVYLSMDDSNVGQFKVNKGSGVGGFTFSTYSANGSLLFTNLNLLSSGVIQAQYYTATGNASDSEAVAIAGLDANGNWVRNYAANARMRASEARLSAIENDLTGPVPVKVNEIVTRLNGLNFFSQDIATIALFTPFPSNGSDIYTSPLPVNYAISPYRGDWFQVQFPTAFVPTAMTIQTRYNMTTRSADDLLIAGSNDGITWYYISQFANLVYPNGSPLTLTFGSVPTPHPQTPGSYSYYRFVSLKMEATPPPLFWEITRLTMLAGSTQYPPLKLTGPTVSGQAYGNGTYTITASQSLILNNYSNVAGLYGVLGNNFSDTSGGYPILSVAIQSYSANGGSYSGGANTNVNHL